MTEHNTIKAVQEDAEREAIERVIVEAAKVAWNEPDPLVVRLPNGRQVMRQFYDPYIHGPAVE
jgi:hypothetical protein